MLEGSSPVPAAVLAPARSCPGSLASAGRQLDQNRDVSFSAGQAAGEGDSETLPAVPLFLKSSSESR